MEKDDFLITTTVNDKSWALIWDQEEALELDYPVYWEIVSSPEGIVCRHRDSGEELRVDEDCLSGEREMSLPLTSGEDRQVNLHFKPVKRIRPAFLTSEEAAKSVGPADQYISSGIREHLIGFREFLKEEYVGQIVDDKIFSLVSINLSVHVISKMAGVRFKPARGESRAMIPGVKTFIQEKELLSGAFIYGSYWWRINKIATPEMLDLDELDDEIQTQDLVSLQSLGKAFGGFLLLVLLMVQGLHYFDHRHDDEKAKTSPITEIELKKPKWIAKAPELPKPIPVKVAKVEPKPKPEKKKKTEPKKVAKKEAPKKKRDAPKVAKKSPPKIAPPKIAQKAAPKAVPKPAPKVAQTRPQPLPKIATAVPKVEKPVARGPDPSVVKAQEKASLAKSLNFLSTGPSKSVGALATNPNAKNSKKYGNTSSNVPPGGASKLSALADQNSEDGPISTRGSRGVASNSGIKGGHGKGLNEVQGKVAFNSLSERGSGDALGAAIGGGGVNVSGPGKISDADIEKTLSKYLEKFQRCYEKALLSDPSISGEVQMSWTIAMNGHVSDAKVVRSEMNKKPLHDCLTGELSKIVFPQPKGGAATVKKPFRFKSSSF